MAVSLVCNGPRLLLQVLKNTIVIHNNFACTSLVSFCNGADIFNKLLHNYGKNKILGTPLTNVVISSCKHAIMGTICIYVYMNSFYLGAWFICCHWENMIEYIFLQVLQTTIVIYNNCVCASLASFEVNHRCQWHTLNPLKQHLFWCRWRLVLTQKYNLPEQQYRDPAGHWWTWRCSALHDWCNWLLSIFCFRELVLSQWNLGSQWEC